MPCARISRRKPRRVSRDDASEPPIEVLLSCEQGVGRRIDDRACIDPGEVVTTALVAIVYRSRATTVCSDTDLFYLLVQARDGNRRSGLTGLLLYDRGFFFQWIEGYADELAKVWLRIQADERHRDVMVLAHAPAAARKFAGWSMGFAHRDGDHARVVHGYVKAAAELLNRLHLNVDRAPQLLASLGLPA